MTTKRAMRAVVLAVALLASGGCVKKPTLLGDTHVGKGELFRAGRPGYDAFFEQTHAVQGEAMVALDEEHRAREPVERIMGESAPTASALGDRVVARAQKKRSGVSSGASAADEAAFAAALATALQSEASVAKKEDGVATRASALSTRADDLLATVDRDFANRNAREEVARELNAAKLILQAAALRTRTVANDADAFVRAASAARETPAPVEAAPAPAAKDRKRVRGKSSRPSADAPHPAKPASDGARPAKAAPDVPRSPPAKSSPPSPPPSKASDDFNP